VGLFALRDTRTPLLGDTIQLIGRAAIMALLLRRIGVSAVPLAFCFMAWLERPLHRCPYFSFELVNELGQHACPRMLPDARQRGLHEACLYTSLGSEGFVTKGVPARPRASPETSHEQQDRVMVGPLKIVDLETQPTLANARPVCRRSSTLDRFMRRAT